MKLPGIFKKASLIALILLGLLVAGYYEYSTLIAEGVYDPKDTHDLLAKNFADNEAAFESVVTYFEQQVTLANKEDIIFESGHGDTVTIIVGHQDRNKNAYRQPIGAPHLDSVIAELEWTNEMLRTLKDELSKTHCIAIRWSELYGGYATQLSPDQTVPPGMKSYTYYITDGPTLGNVQKVHGPALSNSDFGKRAFLDFK